MNMKKLEAYKIFPYVAWILVIGFALYVFSLATELQATTSNLSEDTSYLENAIADPSVIR